MSSQEHKAVAKPIVIGHRGAMGYYPENTLPSFTAAFDQGCAGIEFDVQQSADGQVLVFHDWALERCSNGSGLLREKTADELRHLDAGSYYEARFAGSRIPTLEEVLDHVPAGKLINIEIKELYSEQRGTAEKVTEIIQRRSAEQQQQIVVSSFSHNLLSQLPRLAPALKIGLLLGNTLENLAAYIDQLSFPVYSLHPSISLLKGDEVAWAQAQSIKVYPWTVNHKYEVELCLRLGVDGIISNYPNILERV